MIDNARCSAFAVELNQQGNIPAQVLDLPDPQYIKKFLGMSENAVKTQIRCIVSTYVPTAIVKKELQASIR